jgi:glycosyltransferase involved in cell wall biosynthesis
MERTSAKPTVSVLVPAYNAAHFIRETLDSVFAQTLEPLEVIVVDDGSTDDTDAVLAQYGELIHVIRQENRGCAGAFNTGIRAARGDFVALCPADDIWVPEKLEWQVDALVEHPEVDVVFGHARHFGLEDSDYRRAPGVGVLDHGVLHRTMFEEDLIPDPTAIVRRRLFDDLGLYREDIAAEDYEFWMRALRAGATFYYEPRLLAYLRRHENNLSGQLLRMRRSNYEIHLMYASDFDDQAFVDAVLANDLQKVGRHSLDAGHLNDARKAFAGSVRRRPALRTGVWTLLLAVPGARRAAVALDQRRLRSGSATSAG